MILVHRYWDDPTPPEHAWLAARIHAAGGELRDWTSETVVPELAELLQGPAGLQVSLSERPRHLSNIARWWLLHEYGGIWLDHDVIPLLSLEAGPTRYTGSIGGHRACCVVKMGPGDPDARSMLDTIVQLPAGNGRSPGTSGDHVAQRILPSNLPMRELPYDAAGQRTNGGLWAVHTWNHSGLNPNTTTVDDQSTD